jgi:diacylglycerol kinase family enzyme
MSQQYSHALVIRNGQASRLRNLGDKEFSKAVVVPLLGYGFNKDEIDILNRPNESSLDSKIQKESLIIICGGDGTVSRIANYVIDRSLSETILLPLHFGGANDIANGLYGKKNLEEILAVGTPNTAYTIEATIEKDAQVLKIVRALGYIGLGACGHAAEAINNYHESNSNWVGTIMSAAQAATFSKSFGYKDSDDISKKAVELLAINYWMGGCFQTENNIFQRKFTYIEAENKFQMFGKLCLGLYGATNGNGIAGDSNIIINTENPTILQADGEHAYIDKGTKITINNGPQIRVMSLPK